MELRNILIANTKDQKRYRINTAATTLGELQDQLISNSGVEVYDRPSQTWMPNPSPINLDNLSFTEGISNTQLNDRNSQLPMAVRYKGQLTNNLMIVLTNTVSKIASGALSRKECYEIIKQNKLLQESIKKTYGRNYTQVSTVNLAAAVGEVPDTPEYSQDITAEKNLNNTPSQPAEAPVKTIHPNIVTWVHTGIEMLVQAGKLYTDDIVVLTDLIKGMATDMQSKEPLGVEEDFDNILKNMSL